MECTDSDLWMKNFEILPINRIESVKESFSNASKEVRKVVFECGEKLQVGRCRKLKNLNGEYGVESPFYSQNENRIYMDEGKENDEYIITFRHEYGHFADAQLGRPSMGEMFHMAIQADFAWYSLDTDYGNENLQRLLLETEKSEVFENRYYSDILSAIFHNNKKILQFYDENGVAFYGHSNYYWAEIDGPEMAVEREVFADLFAIYTENNSSIVAFIEKKFPNTAKQFKKLLGGENEHTRV